jgi:anhydro-N-acetylmuramic acid kinase
MSGTSMDGVDAVLVDFAHGLGPQAEHFVAYPPELKRQLLALNTPGNNELHLSALAANEVARLYAQAVNALLQARSLTPQDIVALGAHGQTVRHQPGLHDPVGYTLQLLNAALLSELTGIDVAYDFRARDVAALGQGAPLVPAFHDALFSRDEAPVAVLNLGGISNLSCLPPRLPMDQGEHPAQNQQLTGLEPRALIGFDAGPANVMLDAWCEEHTGEPYDKDGQWASQGRVHPGLLNAMLAHPYFQLPPPKSTGRDLFNRAWLEAQLQACFGSDASSLRPSAADVQATLMELTARACIDALREQCRGSIAPQSLIVCGGGANNNALLARLQGLCAQDPLLTHTSVQSVAALGIGVHLIEALAFAWLAYKRVRLETANAPSVTGALGPRVLGSLIKA